MQKDEDSNTYFRAHIFFNAVHVTTLLKYRNNLFLLEFVNIILETIRYLSLWK